MHLNGKIGNANGLQQELEQILGVESAYVSLFTEMVYVVFDPKELTLESLGQHIAYLDRAED